MTPQEFEKDQSPGPHLMDNSCYQSIALNKGQVHEVLIQNNDKGSVITWDFDVMKHDLVFTVFRTKEIVPDKLIVPGTNNTTISADPMQYTGIGKGWKEGTEYHRVEVPIVCHDGESIQGSHVTQHEATYILQWSHFDRMAGLSGPGENMMDMLTHPQHKAKVMYYCEVLNSLDYRGSMTSLQSTQSGFSVISKVSGHHSTSS